MTIEKHVDEGTTSGVIQRTLADSIKWLLLTPAIVGCSALSVAVVMFTVFSIIPLLVSAIAMQQWSACYILLPFFVTWIACGVLPGPCPRTFRMM
jgi:hypothetical protein